MKISMKRYSTLFACSLLFLGQPVAAQAQPADDAAQAQAEAARALPESNPALILTDNPTRAEAEAYVKVIRQQSAKKSTISIRDPEIEKLSRLPVEHIDLLLREVASGERKISFHAYRAIGSYDSESYRQLAIEGLSEEPAFIYLIARHGWYQQAKTDILAKLKSIDPKNPKFAPIWWQAFLEVAEKEHHPLLHEMTLSFYDLENRLQLLEALPDYDFAKTVAACWEKAKPDANGREPNAVLLDFMRNRSQKASDVLRPYAIRAGQIDALDPLIDQIDPKRKLVTGIGQNLPARALSARHTLRRHLDFKGTNEEIQVWFRTHRDQLVFNPFTQRFELPKD